MSTRTPSEGGHNSRLLATHRALPDSVIAFRLSSAIQRRIQTSLSGALPLRFTAEFEECERIVQESRSTALVVQVPRASANADLAMLISLKRKFPFVSMAGVFVETSSDLSAVAHLGAAGMLDIIPSENASHPDVLRSVLSRCHTESLVARIWRLADLNVPDHAATLLRPAIRLAHGPLTTVMLAAATRRHERSLRKYCQAFGLPSPQWIIGWARVLIVAYYLEEPGRSIQSIATLLGYSSSALMANQLRRYTGLTASDLRSRAPLKTVARQLEAALADMVRVAS